MPIGVLRRYSPFLLALAVTAVIVVILFLRPDSALGLAVNVTNPVNSTNGQPGFKLGEEVVFTGDVNFEGGPERVIDVTLDIIQSGDVDPAFANVIGLSLAIQEVTDLDVSDLMHQASGTTQGTLNLTVILDAVKTIKLTNGYAYGYDDGSTDSGSILIILKYIPPSLPGDYQATIRVATESGQAVTPAVTNFSVLDALTATALATLYPIGDVEALAGDMVILQFDTSADAKDIATVSGVPVATVSTSAGEPLPQAKSLFQAFKVHEALRKKWGVAGEADLILPIRIPDDTLPGSRGPFVATIEDIAGQTFTIPTASSPRVEVVDTRSIFNVYLLPRANLITPPLQCVPAGVGVCNSSFEHDLSELLKQTVPNVDPAFATLLGKTPSDVTAAEVIDVIWGYDSALAPAFRSHLPFLDTGDLKTMDVGNGYIVETTDEPGDPFVRITDPDNEQFPTKAIPVPIKVSLRGRVIAEPDNLLPTTDVETGFNLVGAHAEVDTFIGVWLAPVIIPERTWVQVVTFRNELDIAMDDSGDVSLLADGKPEIVFKTRWESLRSPAGFPDAGPDPLPSGSTVKAGSGLWLRMCESPESTCIGGTLSFVGPAPE
jgi:hypothetical protein